MAKKARGSNSAKLKAADISSIEKGLENLRAEKQVFGKSVAAHKDQELFFIDQHGVVNETERKKLRARGLLLKPLRIDQILQPESAAETLFTKKRHSVAAKGKAAPPKKQRHVVQEKVQQDLWANEDPLAKRITPRPVLNIPAVKLPDAGASYRPETKSHQKLMEQAAAVIIKQDADVEAFKGTLPSLEGRALSTVESAVQEILTGGANAEVSAEEEEQETLSVLAPKKMAKRKTEKDRTKLAKRRAEEMQRVMLSKRKQQKEQLMQAKKIAKELQISVPKQEKKPKSDARVLKRLGPVAFVPQKIAVQLPEEVSGSLRLLRAEGHLAQDRFKSLQERSLIEPIKPRT